MDPIYSDPGTEGHIMVHILSVYSEGIFWAGPTDFDLQFLQLWWQLSAVSQWWNTTKLDPDQHGISSCNLVINTDHAFYFEGRWAVPSFSEKGTELI